MLGPFLTVEYFLSSFEHYSIGQSSDVPTIDLGVSIAPYWYKEMTLSWYIPPSWATKEPRFNIYRSETQVTGFQKLNAVPISTPFFKDETTEESSMHSREFYIVEAILNDGSVWKTVPTTVGSKLPKFQYLRLKEMERRAWILLNRYVGADVMIMREIRYGLPCPKCYDVTARKLVIDYCTSCYGTGVEGGYYPGIRTKMQFDSSTDNMDYTYFGRVEANQVNAWTISAPKIEPEDIIIRLNDFKMFEAKPVNNTEILLKTSRQIVRLEEQPKERVIYELLKRENLV